MGLCFPELIDQMVSFPRERQPNWSTGTHVFLIGLQFQNWGQGLVGPTPRLTSALTLRLPTGLCTHMFQCSCSVETELDPLGCFSCAVSRYQSPRPHLQLPQGADEKTSEDRFIWAKASLMN